MLPFNITDKMQTIEKRDCTIVIDIENAPNPNWGNKGGRKKKGEEPSRFADSNYEKTLRRRRKVIKELCDRGFIVGQCSYVTLTFDPSRFEADKPKNLAFAKNQFENFIKRMKRCCDNFLHVATFARQENGNWHFHMMCNLQGDSKNKRLISETWKNGSTEAKTISDKAYYNNALKYHYKTLEENIEEKRGIRGYSTSVAKDKRLSSTVAKDAAAFKEWADSLISSKRNDIIKFSERHSYYSAKAITDPDTGETVYDCEFSIPHNEFLATQGFIKIHSTRTYYRIPKETVEMPPVATLKPKKKRKRKSKSKKDT